MDYTTLTYKKYKDIHNNILYFDNDLDRTTEMVRIVYDLEFDDVENMPITEYRKLAQSCEFLKYPVDNKLKKLYNTLTINGTDYTLFTDIENMKVSQYIDFSNYIKNVDEKIPEILSCFLIPEGHTYNDGYDIKKTINDINEYLSVQEVMQLSAFFFTSVSIFNKRYNQDENWETEETDEKGEGQDDKGGNEKEDRGSGISTFNWFALIDSFSAITHFNWDEVLEQSIGFFFNVLSYGREKDRREQERIRRFKQTGKWN